MKRFRNPLALILVLHIVLGLSFGVVTPIFEAPDEANHFLFTRYLQINRRLPVQTLDPDGPRAHHPPLYFALAALMSAWVPNAGNAERIELPNNPTLWFRYGDPATDHKVKYVHSAQEGWPWHGQALAVHVIRVVSVIFSTLAVWFTYLAAQPLWPVTSVGPLLASALLAFNPMVLFMSGVAQNSTAALASSAALLCALSRWVITGFTVQRALGLGILFSIAVLIQTSGLTLAAPAGAALIYDAARQRRWQNLWVNGLVFGGTVAVLTGWWFARNQMLYGDWTANAIVAALWSNQPIMPLSQTWYLLTTGMVGRFGFGLIIEYLDVIYRLADVLAILALVGFVRQLGFKRAQGRLNDNRALWTMHAITVLGVGAALAAYIYFYIRGGHGRYMFTAYPSLMLLLAAGALAWFPKERHQKLTALTMAGLSFGLATYGLVGLVYPTYAPPPSPTATQLKQMVSIEADLGGAARIVGYHAQPVTVRPGQTLSAVVHWQPLDYTDVPYTVFIHLLDSTLNTIAQVDTYPGRGHWVTTTWTLGRVFVDTYLLTLPTDTPPMKATLVAGLYDANSQLRLPVTGANAGSPDERWVVLGSVTIQP